MTDTAAATSGRLRKMRTELAAPTNYTLILDNDEQIEIPLNALIGQPLKIEFTGRIFCCNCDRLTRKSFSQGYCYTCFRKLAETDQCIMSPERCHFDAGTCRDPEWAESHCMRPHVVYLSNTSGVKVGITREDQVPTRWIDQGAVAAIPIASVSRRQLAGFLEAGLREHVSDRTQWQRMLKNEAPQIELEHEWQALQQKSAQFLADLQEEHGMENIALDTSPVGTEILYPHEQPPEKVKTHNFDKNPVLQDVLTGIKGQYLIFENVVVNVRKYTSYEVVVSTSG